MRPPLTLPLTSNCGAASGPVGAGAKAQIRRRPHSRQHFQRFGKRLRQRVAQLGRDLQAVDRARHRPPPGRRIDRAHHLDALHVIADHVALDFQVLAVARGPQRQLHVAQRQRARRVFQRIEDFHHAVFDRHGRQPSVALGPRKQLGQAERAIGSPRHAHHGRVSFTSVICGSPEASSCKLVRQVRKIWSR